MKLNLEGLAQKEFWNEAKIEIPAFDMQAVRKETAKHPAWVHFGAGNIFRAFIADVQQELLEAGDVKTGIIAVDTFDYDIIDKIYTAFDHLTMAVYMYPDGTLKKKVIGSVTEAIKGCYEDKVDFNRLKEIFREESLQMVSFTITEKGYALNQADGGYLPVIVEDICDGPEKPNHAMSVLAALLYERYQNGRAPLAVVSMDNCSHNGEKLANAVLKIAREWEAKGFVDQGFLDYLIDESCITFPWSMIDKITPRPAQEVKADLEALGMEEMEPIITSRNTYIAPFVNAEVPRYLIIEDKFPNGRPPLEKTKGVYLTDRETVNNTERMKVTTCLNPLHTALAVYGCLLGYSSIAEEMKDEQLKALVERIGYQEGMPVVVHPGILDPLEFIHEVVDVRLPNPFIPDMPQRIATDTSQKVGIRFGETIKAYVNSPDLEVSQLVGIPLAIAGWCRYLLGIDDRGQAMELSSDPMQAELKQMFSGVSLGQADTAFLKPLLSNEKIFGINLYEAGLGDRIEGYFSELSAGAGAVRATLKKYL